MKRKELLINLSLLLGVILFFFIIIEVVLISVGYDNHHGIPDGMIQRDSETEFSLVPLFEGRYNAKDFDTTIKINKDGFRDKDHDLSIPSRRIMGLGDSYTFGNGVEMNETYLWLLEEKEENTIIFKTGLGSYGTDNQVALYKKWRGTYKPDLVFLMMSPNDILDNIYWGERFSKEGEEKGVLSSVFKLHSSLRKKIKTYDFLYIKIEQLPFLKKLKTQVDVPESFQYLFFSEDTDLTNQGWNNTFNLLAELQNLVEEDNAKLIVSITPHKTQYDSTRIALLEESAKEKGVDLDLFKVNRRIEEYLNEKGVEFIDLTKAFDETLPEEVFLPFDGHWNKKGHALAASILEKEI